MGEKWWQFIYRIPADRNPLFDLTGAQCGVAQSGPVWILASVVDPGGPATIDRSCTLPEGKALLVSPGGTLNDFPCPAAFHFDSPPGVPLFDFLKDGIAPIVNSVNGIDITVAGVAVATPFAYREQSRHLFEIEGDPSLASVLDPCITGTPQPAFSDGYFTMLRPLAAGHHELSIHATDTKGTDLTLNWHLNVMARH